MLVDMRQAGFRIIPEPQFHLMTLLETDSLYQFPQRLGIAIDQILWPAGWVGDGGAVDVDAHVVVEGGKDFLESDGAFAGDFGEAVGGADDLAGTHAAAGQ